MEQEENRQQSKSRLIRFKCAPQYELDDVEKAIVYLARAARCLNRAGGHERSVRIIRECFDHILCEL